MILFNNIKRLIKSVNYNYKIANFYMLLKLHKSHSLNEILDIEGRPIVAGSAYHAHEISILTDKIMEPILKEILHIRKDTFDFAEKQKHKKI